MVALTLGIIDQLTGGRLGQFDIACPLCGPQRRAPANQRRKVLRVYRIETGFATFHCARCGESGHTRDSAALRPDPAAVARARAEALERERSAVVERMERAQWLWSRRRPIIGSIAETYLRTARGYAGPLPATLGYLPPRGKHGPAMIAAFGLATEYEPGQAGIYDAAVRGVHLTRLAPDGSAKAGTATDKIMVGSSNGHPIVLAPPNDLHGLAIAEGIEDALSAGDAIGLGAWAAGSASRLPALVDAVPGYIEAVTVLVDDDDDGRRQAHTLAERLRARGIETRLILPGRAQRAAA